MYSDNYAHIYNQYCKYKYAYHYILLCFYCITQYISYTYIYIYIYVQCNYKILYYTTSYYILSYYNISYHIILYHIISYQLISIIVSIRRSRSIHINTIVKCIYIYIYNYSDKYAHIYNQYCKYKYLQYYYLCIYVNTINTQHNYIHTISYANTITYVYT